MRPRSLKPPLPSRPSWWLEERARSGRGRDPALEDRSSRRAVVGGGYTGLWTGLALRERRPLAERRACSRRARSATARAAATAASCTATGRRSRRSARVLGDGAALQLAHASGRIVPAVRDFLEQRGEDVWLREGGLLKVAADRGEERVVAGRCGRRESSASRRRRSRSPRRGRPGLDSPRFPRRRLLPRRRDRAAGAPRPGAEARRRHGGRAAVRAHARDDDPAGQDRDAGLERSRPRDRARAERVGDGLAARGTADDLCERGRADGAGARPARARSAGRAARRSPTAACSSTTSGRRPTAAC
jgi:hypothetical protein